jgi:hypothetical protein
MIISKELASAVLGVTVTSINIHPNRSTYDYWKERKEGVDQKIGNIHELAHLCKVWCYEQRYTIIDLGKWKDSEQASGFSYSTIAKSFDVPLSKAVTYSYNDRFHAVTEHEAVIKAARWVLEHAS